MEFTKTKRREWRDTEKLGYRVTQSKVHGLPTRYYACVRSVHENGQKWWNFCQHRRPYKTLSKAIEACEFNRKLWAALIELGGASGNRKCRLDTLSQRGKQGGGNVLLWTPVWAKPKVAPVLLRMLSPYTQRASRDDDECNDRSDPTKTSPPTDSTSSPNMDESAQSSPKTRTAGPASNVEATSESSIPNPSESTKAVPNTSRARAARKPGSAAKPNTKKPTKPKSKATRKPRKSTASY